MNIIPEPLQLLRDFVADSPFDWGVVSDEGPDEALDAWFRSARANLYAYAAILGVQPADMENTSTPTSGESTGVLELMDAIETAARANDPHALWPARKALRDAFEEQEKALVQKTERLDEAADMLDTFQGSGCHDLVALETEVCEWFAEHPELCEGDGSARELHGRGE